MSKCVLMISLGVCYLFFFYLKPVFRTVCEAEFLHLVHVWVNINLWKWKQLKLNFFTDLAFRIFFDYFKDGLLIKLDSKLDSSE